MQHSVRVALYNHLFARSIVALCSGVGGNVPLRGKGLNINEDFEIAKSPFNKLTLNDGRPQPLIKATY